MFSVTSLAHAYQNNTIFSDVSFSLHKGNSMAVIGPSGVGKSTLMHVCSTLLQIQQGKISLGTYNLHTMNYTQQTLFRRKHVGFVYQSHHLLPELTLKENILLPLRLNGLYTLDHWAYGKTLTQTFGIEDCLQRYPFQVSGGQRQRAAVIRAIIHKPDIIFADEPTGNLDDHHSHAVMQTLMQTIKQEHSMAIIVTHNPDLLPYVQQTYAMKHKNLVPTS